jgi:hypothetical protein
MSSQQLTAAAVRCKPQCSGMKACKGQCVPKLVHTDLLNVGAWDIVTQLQRLSHCCHPGTVLALHLQADTSSAVRTHSPRGQLWHTHAPNTNHPCTQETQHARTCTYVPRFSTSSNLTATSPAPAVIAVLVRLMTVPTCWCVVGAAHTTASVSVPSQLSLPHSKCCVRQSVADTTNSSCTHLVAQGHEST